MSLSKIWVPPVVGFELDTQRAILWSAVAVGCVMVLSLLVRSAYEMGRADEALTQLRNTRSEPEVLIATLRNWLEKELEPKE